MTIKVETNNTYLVYAWLENMKLTISEPNVDPFEVELDDEQKKHLTDLTMDYMETVAMLFKVARINKNKVAKIRLDFKHEKELIKT